MKRGAWLLPKLLLTLFVTAACGHAVPAVAQPAVIDLGAPPGHSAGAGEGAGEGVAGEGEPFMAAPGLGEPGAVHALSGAGGWEPAEGMLSPAPEPAAMSLLAVMAALLVLRPRRASRPRAESLVWIRPDPPAPPGRTSLRTIR